MSNLIHPRLIALDLDGTLLDRQGAVTPRTRQAIADAVAQGVVVLPATGRPLSNLPPVVAQLPGIRYAITSNGAAVWDLGADPMSAVYSRYWNAAEHRTTEPTARIARPMPVALARAASRWRAMAASKPSKSILTSRSRQTSPVRSAGKP